MPILSISKEEIERRLYNSNIPCESNRVAGSDRNSSHGTAAQAVRNLKDAQEIESLEKETDADYLTKLGKDL